MGNGLIEAGATLKQIYDEDANKIKKFLERYPKVSVAKNQEEILKDENINMVASAIVPYKRSSLGIKVMKNGKDFFVDKPGMLKLHEIEDVQAICEDTGKKYIVYFGERIHVEGVVFAEQLIKENIIGKILQMTILAPHRLNKDTRPQWFFEKDKNGGIITDIGSHQIEQFLHFCGAKTAKIMHSFVKNHENKDKPDFFDYGEGILLSDNGATCYFRVDWFTPQGLRAWGDGRVFIVGTKGTIEIRKYIDVSRDTKGDHVFWVDEVSEHYENVSGKVGFIFFGKLILDCLNRTENAITQEHVFETMRITIKMQENAEKNFNS
jgi:predicted dehydrogenase